MLDMSVNKHVCYRHVSKQTRMLDISVNNTYARHVVVVTFAVLVSVFFGVFVNCVGNNIVFVSAF